MYKCCGKSLLGTIKEKAKNIVKFSSIVLLTTSTTGRTKTKAELQST